MKMPDESLVVVAITFIFFGGGLVYGLLQAGIVGVIMLCILSSVIGFYIGKYVGGQKAGTYYQDGYEAGKRDAAGEYPITPATQN